MKQPDDNAAPAAAPEQILNVARTLIRPSPLNPRTVFPEHYLNETGLNIRNNGLINPLIVREKRHGLVFGEDADDHYELIAGECRWRSTAERPHPELAGVTMAAVSHLQVIVRNLPDAAVLELMLSENMKRRDLSPLEEMDGFSRMLAQAGEDGKPLHTVKSLAEKLGVGERYIGKRLSLAKLTKRGREALARGPEQGGLSFFAAVTICESPAVVIPMIEDEALNPKKYDHWRDGDGALTAEEILDVRREKYVRQLRGAPFEQNDPNLVPLHLGENGERIEGGACTDCPWNTANQAEQAEKQESRKGQRGGRHAGEGHFCLNTVCFKKKVEVNVAATLVKAQAQGCKILNEAETKKAMSESGYLHHNSAFVKLEEKPEYSDRNHAMDEKKVPTWEKIAMGKDAAPPVVVAVDKNGKVHRLVERKLAVEAARKNGTEKFLSLGSGRGRSKQEADVDERRKREAEKAKVRSAQARAVMAGIVASVVKDAAKAVAGFFANGLRLAVRHAGHAGCTFVAKRREIEVPKNKSVGDAVEKWGEKLKGDELTGLLFELLLSQDFSYADSPHCGGDVVPESAKPFLKPLRVDPAAIKKQVEAEHAAKKKAKQGKEPKAANKSAAGKKPAKGLTPAARAELAAKMKARWAKAKGGSKGAAAPAAASKLKPGQMKCCYCDYVNSPNGFSSHACKAAPDVPGVGRFKTTGTRPLTLEEIQMSRIESGLKPSPRIAKELAKKTPPVVHTSSVAGAGKSKLAEIATQGVKPGKKKQSKASPGQDPHEWMRDQILGVYLEKSVPVAAFDAICRKHGVEGKFEDDFRSFSIPALDAILDELKAWKPDVLIEEDEYQANARKVREHFAEGDRITVAKVQTKLRLGYTAALGICDAMIEAGEIVEGKLAAGKGVQI